MAYMKKSKKVTVKKKPKKATVTVKGKKKRY